MIRLSKINAKKVIDIINKYSDEALIEVKGVNLDTASKLAQTAKRLSPVDEGVLRNSIKVEDFDKINYNVGTNLPYAPYIEFGTGRKVKVPKEFSDLAQKARSGKKGSFKDGLLNIQRWCKRKGIEEKFAYIIFVNILNNGMEGKPFMYPAYIEAKRNYNKDMEKAFDKLAKRFNK